MTTTTAETGYVSMGDFQRRVEGLLSQAVISGEAKSEKLRSGVFKEHLEASKELQITKIGSLLMVDVDISEIRPGAPKTGVHIEFRNNGMPPEVTETATGPENTNTRTVPVSEHNTEVAIPLMRMLFADERR